MFSQRNQEIPCFYFRKMTANQALTNANAMDTDDERDLNTDNDKDTDMNSERMPKCTKCRRYTYGHTHPYGPRCTKKRKRDEEIEEENKETLEKRRKMLKERQDKEESVVIEQETLPIPRPESEVNVPITVYTGHGTPVTSGAPSSAASTAPVNTAAGAGGLDANTANFFQQLLMQQSQMQQQSQSFMTQMFQSMSSSGGMNPPVNHGYKLPVPEWNQDMSFEAWKRKIFNFKAQSSMNENQKLILILESLKKNKEREELKDWIIQEIDEDTTFDMNHE